MNKIDVELNELTKQMDYLKDQEARLDFELKQTKKEIEKIEIQLATVLDCAGVESMDFGVYSFGWETKTRVAFNQKAFGQMYPDLLEKFKLPSESKKIKFKINK